MLSARQKVFSAVLAFVGLVVYGYFELREAARQARAMTPETFLRQRLVQVDAFMRAIDVDGTYSARTDDHMTSRFDRYLSTCPTLPVATLVFYDERDKLPLPSTRGEHAHLATKHEHLLGFTFVQRMAMHANKNLTCELEPRVPPGAWVVSWPIYECPGCPVWDRAFYSDVSY